MYCNNCKQDLPVDAPFCIHCGTATNEEETDVNSSIALKSVETGNQRKNTIGSIVFSIGIIEVICSVIVFFMIGKPEMSYDDFNYMVALPWLIIGTVSGFFTIAFAEIIFLLSEIKNKISTDRKSVV